MSNDYSLNATQLKGLNRLGDLVIPGGHGYPSFSESRAARGIDGMLPYMYAGDRDPLKGLLFACAYLPRPVITALLTMVAAHAKVPGPLAAVFRLAHVGIKGIVHSLYYSDLQVGGTPSIHQRLRYNPVMNVEAYEQYLAENAEEAATAGQVAANHAGTAGEEEK
ncbi:MULTISPECIES: hypothetical protein [Corynebacterium]|uniref:hypothetical protein n=1 Tax=Corynebacterium TaxID=1716 RepID=UPI00186588E5|nr:MULTISPECIES: hypothetical protein [Corynebacterium]